MVSACLDVMAVERTRQEQNRKHAREDQRATKHSLRERALREKRCKGKPKKEDDRKWK